MQDMNRKKFLEGQSYTELPKSFKSNIFFYFRGISSVVRRCIDKETGKEYAAKIIDLGIAEGSDSNQMLESTRQEINILREVKGHPYLSKYNSMAICIFLS